MNTSTQQKRLGNATYTSMTRLSNELGGTYQHVSLGFVKERMEGETRVAITPSAVREFVANGHQVFFETGAGLLSGFQDQFYIDAGAQMLQNGQQVYQKSQIMMKVMQPIPQEYEFVQANQIIFCFMNYTNEKQFLQEMMQRRAIIMNYDVIGDRMNSYPVLNAVSEVAGFMAVQQGMKYLEAQQGGAGMLLGNVAGVEGARVLILGGGAAALRAAMFASNLGARVTVMDIGTENLRFIAHQLPSNVQTMTYSMNALERVLPKTDLLIGAVLPMMRNNLFLVNKNLMKLMREGTVAVDLGMGYGQNFETSQLTTWEKPTFKWNNVLHFCVRNITAAVAHTTSQAISNAVLPYALQVANLGWRRATVENVELLQGCTIIENHLTCQRLSMLTQLPFTPIEQILEPEINQATNVQKSNGHVWNLKQQLTNLHSNWSRKTGFFTIEA